MDMHAMSASPLVTVHLYGELGDKFGHKFELAVGSVAEAVRLLEANFNGFCKWISSGAYIVTRGGKEWDDGKSVAEHELAVKFKGQDIHIVPAVRGRSKKGGVFQIVLGVVLIGAAFVLSGGLSLGLQAGFTAMSGTLWGTVASVGAAMAIGGVVQLLTPSPKAALTPEQADQRKSSLFGGPINAANQGMCVPVVYGRAICGSVVVSAGIHVTQAGIATSPYGDPGNSMGSAVNPSSKGFLGNVWRQFTPELVAGLAR